MADDKKIFPDPAAGKTDVPSKAAPPGVFQSNPFVSEQSAPVKPEPPAAEAVPKTATPPTAEKTPKNKSAPTPAKQPAPAEKTAPRDKGSPAAEKDAPSKDKEPPAKPAPEEKQTTIPGMEAPAGKMVNFSAVKERAVKGMQTDKSPEAPKPRRDRLSKKNKPAPGKAALPPRDKTSRSKEPHSPAPGSAAKVTAADQTAVPPRPVEDQKVVYLKLVDMHPFHTYREHPFSVRDDAKMQETVASIKRNGVMVPGLARPEKDGNGYEIISGHRRHRGSELAGLNEMPFIVREMTDHEAVQAMKDSNKQRGEVLPMEMARLLDLEMEDIKHQGVALKNVAPGDIGKRSAEIVGEAHGMNYKKVMRYIRLNSLVSELQDMVDGVAVNSSGEPMKKLGFIPAVELSYIRPRNQQLIAVSIEGEQASPSVAQAKRLRELDQAGKLTGDIIDAILSEEKKEVGQVIISTEELSKYFGQEATPRQMKDQIIALLDEWKEKQPPEKKAELEK